MKKNPHLEGPKKHHDDHGKNASVPAKGNKRAIPNDHWEMQYSPCPYKDTNHVMGAEFNAMPASRRMTTHNKVNPEDH